MSDAAVIRHLSSRGVATVTLNRPAVNNAYNTAMIYGLLATLDALAAESALRVVVIRGSAGFRSAQTSLGWMKSRTVRLRTTSRRPARRPKRFIA